MSFMRRTCLLRPGRLVWLMQIASTQMTRSFLMFLRYRNADSAFSLTRKRFPSSVIGLPSFRFPHVYDNASYSGFSESRTCLSRHSIGLSNLAGWMQRSRISPPEESTSRYGKTDILYAVSHLLGEQSSTCIHHPACHLDMDGESWGTEIMDA